NEERSWDRAAFLRKQEPSRLPGVRGNLQRLGLEHALILILWRKFFNPLIEPLIPALRPGLLRRLSGLRILVRPGPLKHIDNRGAEHFARVLRFGSVACQGTIQKDHVAG